MTAQPSSPELAPVDVHSINAELGDSLVRSAQVLEHLQTTIDTGLAEELAKRDAIVAQANEEYRVQAESHTDQTHQLGALKQELVELSAHLADIPAERQAFEGALQRVEAQVAVATSDNENADMLHMSAVRELNDLQAAEKSAETAVLTQEGKLQEIASMAISMTSEQSTAAQSLSETATSQIDQLNKELASIRGDIVKKREYVIATSQRQVSTLDTLRTLQYQLAELERKIAELDERYATTEAALQSLCQTISELSFEQTEDEDAPIADVISIDRHAEEAEAPAKTFASSPASNIQKLLAGQLDVTNNSGEGVS